ncbi:hypothetical protein GCM10011409_33440 [Lentibacillus populi]|uniref:PTS EIIA type-1 domain-containing protein n=1 Tax=Lentibacillus populi TaxID=1827502 RepID=A0A9W5X6Q5_9BACI|nr:PTS glucose transporter subunit IIA [Lentibacillus populi]GGB53176.1 hypothetical protein GCM10011409_33440 [Lentibacillus populi]
MLHLLKKISKSAVSTNDLVAFADGKLIPLKEVPDDVFSNQMMGEGMAIRISNDTIVSPTDGVITSIFPTLHAFSMMLTNGIEILIHIGLDTVELKGKGFKKLINENSQVKKGKPIIKVDRALIEKNGFDLTTMMIVVDDKGFKISYQTQGNASGGKTVVATIDN